MGKTINSNKGKAETPARKKKGRPKKKPAKLDSPTKQIEKEERKGRGRPRKNPIARKPNPAILALNDNIHLNQATLTESKWLSEEAHTFPLDSGFGVPHSLKGARLADEARDQAQMDRPGYAQNPEGSGKSRRNQRMLREEREKKQVAIEERLRNMETMMSCLGMMVFALHKKTVNKGKKDMIDDYIRRGFNAGTAVMIQEQMMRDVNHFEKTRKNSVTLNMEGSMMSGQNSVKHLGASSRNMMVEPKPKPKRGRGRPKSKKNIGGVSMKNQSGKSSTGKGKVDRMSGSDLIKARSSQILEETEKKSLNMGSTVYQGTSKLTRTNSLGMQGVIRLSRENLNNSIGGGSKRRESSLKNLAMNQSLKKTLSQVEEEAPKVNPISDLLTKATRAKRRTPQLDEDFEEVESEEFMPEEMLKKRKTPALEKIKIENPEPFRKKTRLTPLSSKPESLPTRPPQSNIVSIDPKGDAQDNSFAFKAVLRPKPQAAPMDGELSFRNDKTLEAPISEKNKNPKFLFAPKKTTNPSMSFSNFKNTQSKTPGTPPSSKPAQLPTKQDQPSPIQRILENMRQPIQEKPEKNATLKTHQGSENESHNREESDEDEEFPYDEIGF